MYVYGTPEGVENCC